MRVVEAAKYLGVTPGAIREAITEDRLGFVEQYGIKLLHKDDLDAYKLKTRPDGVKPRGRPRKTQQDPGQTQ